MGMAFLVDVAYVFTLFAGTFSGCCTPSWHPFLNNSLSYRAVLINGYTEHAIIIYCTEWGIRHVLWIWNVAYVNDRRKHLWIAMNIIICLSSSWSSCPNHLSLSLLLSLLLRTTTHIWMGHIKNTVVLHSKGTATITSCSCLINCLLAINQSIIAYTKHAINFHSPDPFVEQTTNN